jgi:argininosuccinate lyase
MPQKKNPDAAELLRGKGPRVAASLANIRDREWELPGRQGNKCTVY